MSRFNDSPDLFGCGSGFGTYGDITCDICKQSYNEGEDERGVYDGDSVSFTDFAGLQVCECCFEKIENEVLRRMPDILTWYSKLINEKSKAINNNKELLNKTLDKIKDIK